MNKRKIWFIERIVLILCFFLPVSLFGQNVVRNFSVIVPIVDKLSQRELMGGFDVRNPSDSTIIAMSLMFVSGKGASAEFKTDLSEVLLKVYNKEAVVEDGRLIGMKVADDYEPEWILLDLPENGGEISIGQVALGHPKKMKKTLGEVTVTASKVMFYHKGDTLVYNADAFVLAEGSMLDALLEQLPGVKLGNDGVITVNGKRVDNLLLNGKDLFNGKNELMLDNLAAYTVKDIAVYDKRSRAAELMNDDAVGETKHVMDVRLKRQYSMGWIVNAEAGYGTHDRYLGKLFGMWFSDNVSATLYGGINNLSDANKPGKQDGSWNRENMGEGVMTRQYGGMTYIAQGQADRWTVQGDIDARHVTSDIDNATDRRYYLAGGDAFENSWQRGRNKSLQLSTDHTAYMKFGDRTALEVKPEFRYEKLDRNDILTSISLNEEVADLSRDLVECVYAGENALRHHIINRQLDSSTSGQRTVHGKLKLENTVRVKSTGTKGMMTIGAEGRINDKRNDVTSEQTLNYGYTGFPAHIISQRYDNPERSDFLSAKVEYRFITSWKNKSHFPVAYEFLHNKEKGHRSVYRREFEQNVETTAPHLYASNLPIDADLSNRETLVENNHRIKFAWSANVEAFTPSQKTKYYLFFNTSADANVADRSYDYRVLSDAEPSLYHRRSVLPEVRFNLTFFYLRKADNWMMNGWKTTLDLNLLGIAAPMSAMVDRPVIDPLYVRLGNPDLVDPLRCNVSLSSSRTMRNQIMHTVKFDYMELINGLVSGMNYDKATGVRTIKSYNIDGNRNIKGSYQLFIPIGSKRLVDVTTVTAGIYNHSVDMSGTGIVSQLSFRSVNTFTASEKLAVNWKTGRHRISVHGEYNWSDYRSSDSGFLNFSARTAKYGLSAVLNLPYDLSFSTDMTLYTRRGFADARLNTTDAVWNARLSKSLMHGSLTFAVDAYDMLRQLSNITYTVNAQARTEVVSNVIPNYVLFHVLYKFNKQPSR